jgi:hypothetical protein
VRMSPTRLEADACRSVEPSKRRRTQDHAADSSAVFSRCLLHWAGLEFLGSGVPLLHFQQREDVNVTLLSAISVMVSVLSNPVSLTEVAISVRPHDVSFNVDPHLGSSRSRRIVSVRSAIVVSSPCSSARIDARILRHSSGSGRIREKALFVKANVVASGRRRRSHPSARLPFPLFSRSRASLRACRLAAPH